MTGGGAALFVMYYLVDTFASLKVAYSALLKSVTLEKQIYNSRHKKLRANERGTGASAKRRMCSSRDQRNGI